MKLDKRKGAEVSAFASPLSDPPLLGSEGLPPCSPEGGNIGDAFIQIEAKLRQRGEQNLGNRLPEGKDQPAATKPTTGPFTGAAAK